MKKCFSNYIYIFTGITKINEINNDQSSIILNDHDDNVNEDNDVKQNTTVVMTCSQKNEEKQQPANKSNIKTIKLLMLAVSEQSIQTLSYNYPNNNDQFITLQYLSCWLEWRNSVFTLSIYQMLGLTNHGISSDPGIVERHSTKHNLDLLLDFKCYAAAVGDKESTNTVDNNSIPVDKNNRKNSSIIKPTNDYDSEDKKKNSIPYTKDFHDLFLDKLVRNSKQQYKIGESIMM